MINQPKWDAFRTPPSGNMAEAVERQWLVDVIGQHTFPQDAADMILSRLCTPSGEAG